MIHEDPEPEDNRTFLTILQGFLLLVILSSLFSVSVSLILYPFAESGNLTDEIATIAVQQESALPDTESGTASGHPKPAEHVTSEQAAAVQENVDQMTENLGDMAENIGPFQPFAVCMYAALSVLFVLFTVIGRKTERYPVLRSRKSPSPRSNGNDTDDRLWRKSRQCHSQPKRSDLHSV